jgi:hypothetical protein
MSTTDPSLASYVTSALDSHMMQAVSLEGLTDLEHELLSVAHRWAAEHGYSLDGWGCVCLLPPLTGCHEEPFPVRVLRDGMAEPVLCDCRLPVSLSAPPWQSYDNGRLTVLLRDPVGILTELDAADWMIRNRWNAGLGWGKQRTRPRLSP